MNRVSKLTLFLEAHSASHLAGSTLGQGKLDTPPRARLAPSPRPGPPEDHTRALLV